MRTWNTFSFLLLDAATPMPYLLIARTRTRRAFTTVGRCVEANNRLGRRAISEFGPTNADIEADNLDRGETFEVDSIDDYTIDTVIKLSCELFS